MMLRLHADVSLVPPIFCQHRAQTKYSNFIISLTDWGSTGTKHCGGKYSKTVSGARTHKTNKQIKPNAQR
jgi:hypothetical protein